MTLLVFRTAERIFATTSWTAETLATVPNVVKVSFLGEHEPGSPHQRVYFALPIADFLAKKVGDTIDMREWQEQGK